MRAHADVLMHAAAVSYTKVQQTAAVLLVHSRIRALVRRMTCGYRPPFTCKAACTALNTNRAEALKLPAKMTCSTSGEKSWDQAKVRKQSSCDCRLSPSPCWCAGSQTEAAGGLADGHTPNSLPEWATAAELVKERLSGATAGGSRRKLAGSHQMRRRLTSRSVRAEQDQQSEQQSRQQQDQRQQQQQQQQQQRQRESTVQQQRQQQREQQVCRVKMSAVGFCRVSPQTDLH